MQNGLARLNRRNAPTKRIEPGLPFSEESNFNRYSAVLGGTRPPVVGREVTLDPDRTKRYDSSEDHLSKYLKALELKTAAGKQRASLKDEDISDISLSSDSDTKNVIASKGIQFLKPNISKATVQRPSTSTATGTGLVNIQSARSSDALQKAQAFANKYKLEKKLSADGIKTVESVEKLFEVSHDSDHSESLSKSTDSSSDLGLLNVKDLIDLPSLSDASPPGSPEHSQDVDANLPSKLSSFDDPPESETLISPPEQLLSVDVAILGSKHSSAPLPDPTNEDISEYEEDFEEELDSSRASSLASENSSFNRNSEANSTESESETSDVQDVTSSQQSSRKEAARVRRKVTIAEKTPTVCSLPNVQNGVNQETQTANAFIREENLSNVIVVRNLPQAAQPMFPSYLEAMTQHHLPVPALDEMTRQHLQTIRLLKDSQERSYEMLVTALKPNFQYTTWERTQKVLEKQRQRRQLRSKK